MLWRRPLATCDQRDEVHAAMKSPCVTRPRGLAATVIAAILMLPACGGVGAAPPIPAPAPVPPSPPPHSLAKLRPAEVRDGPDRRPQASMFGVNPGVGLFRRFPVIRIRVFDSSFLRRDSCGRVETCRPGCRGRPIRFAQGPCGSPRDAARTGVGWMCPQWDMSKHRPIADDPTVDRSHLLKDLGLVSVYAENKRGIDLTQTKIFNRMIV